MRGPGGGPYLDKYNPDIILLHIGTNQVDGSAGAENDVKNILDQVDLYEQRAGKEVTVVLAKIILTAGLNNTEDLDAAAKSYNARIRAMAEERVKQGDRIVFVDMQDGANLIYKVAPDNSGPSEGDFNDNLHPNPKGYAKMAQVWFSALDKLLNVQPPAPDTQAPETTIAAKPAALENKNTASFTFTSNESGVTFQVSVDGAAFKNAVTPFALADLADGEHTLSVRAMDEAGNIDASPATFTWTIDTKAPAAPVVITPKNGAMLNIAKPALSGTAEANSTVTVTIDGKVIGTSKAASNGSWSLTPATALAQGEHNLSAKAVDAAGNSSTSSASVKFTIDSLAPETTIATGPAEYESSKEATFEFESNETNVTFQVSLNGAGYVDAETPYTIKNLSEGTQTLAVRAVDISGNTDASPVTYTWVVDTQAPAAPVITGVSEDRGPESNDNITSDNTLVILGKAEANAIVTVFKAGVTLGKTKAASNGNWEFSNESESLAEGEHTFTASATDAAGNKGPVSAGLKVQIDLTAPTAVLSSSSKAAVKEAFEITLKFSEAAYGVAAGDFSVTNGTLSNFNASDRQTYTAVITPTADGAVVVTYAAGKATDVAGNANQAASTLQRTYDATQPKVILRTDAAAIVNTPFDVIIAFDEAVTGFDAAGISLTNGTTSNFSKVNASTYTATITPAADGEVSVRVLANKAFDAAANGNEASAVLKRLYDVEHPSVVLQTEASNPTNAAFTVQVQLSEPVKNFTSDDVKSTNGTVSNLAKVNDKVYTVLVTPASNGEVTVQVPANAVQDMAANGNEASNKITRLYDASRPAVSISTDASEKINKAFVVTVDFSEAVSGFTLADFVLANATTEELQRISDQKYTAVVKPAKDGAVAVSIPANKVQDAATNGNTASNKLERLYDTTAPTGYAVKFSVDKVDADNQASISLNVTGAEIGATYTYRIVSERSGNEVKGAAQVKSASFTIPNLNLTALADGLLTVSLTLADELGNEGAVVRDQVQKLTKNVVAVSAIATINVPFKTDFKNIPLPATVEVTFSNGVKENLNVNWEAGNYNKEVPAAYVLSGELQLSQDASNTNKMPARVTVQVEPNRPPTAIGFSATSFKPDIKSGELIGSFSTTDPDDSEFTYTLVSGQGDEHNAIFEISNQNELRLKTEQGLTGVSKFSIRVRSTDPYQNSIEQIVMLTKTPYQPKDKLNFINAFSPDGDGRNDTWAVPELRYYNQVEVEVFDRSGVRLFHTTNPEEGWDGRGTSGSVKPGPYFYIIQIKDIGLVQKGVVTILN
ncbi:hypothetical protein GCM10028895_01550 [Pontibacter rugosus]